MRSISVLLVLSAGAMFAQDRYERLMQDILIFDAHIDTPRYFVDEGYKLEAEHGYYELDIPRMKKGKLGAVLFGIYAQPQNFPARDSIRPLSSGGLLGLLSFEPTRLTYLIQCRDLRFKDGHGNVATLLA
jgi:hypothetical protein